MKGENSIFFAKRIRVQRNFFLCLVILLIGSNLLFAWKMVTTSREIVVIPYERGGSFAMGQKPDESYVATMTDTMLNDLLNFSPSTVLLKKQNLLKHVDSSAWANMEAYFSATAEQFQKLNLSTYFTRKSMAIDMDKLSVLVNGVLTVKYGKGGFEETEKLYLLGFVFDHGKLLLKSFEEVKGGKN